MQTRVKCPTCGRLQKVTDATPGQLYLCPACGGKFRVNVPTPVEPLAPEPTNMPESVSVSAGPSQYFYAAFGVLAILMVIIGVLLVLNLTNKNAASAAGSSATTPPAPTPAPAPVAAAPATPEVVNPSASTTGPIAGAQPWWAKGSGGTGSATASPATPAALAATPGVALDGVLSALSAPPASRPAASQPDRPAANPAWSPVQPLLARVDTADRADERIGEAIHRGISFLLSQFQGGLLKGTTPDGNAEEAGKDALAVYALLQAGAATNDLRISPHSKAIGPMLDELKKLPIEHNYSTYAHSLRISALSVYNRGEDHDVLRADADWLLHAAAAGAYTYDEPEKFVSGDANPNSYTWDNSNSQYGVLGVWAASDAGITVPSLYWTQVQKHWIATQTADGEWPYSTIPTDTRSSMTVAGLTMLFVTEDQLNTPANGLADTQLGKAIARGLGWLETGDNVLQLYSFWPSYNLYGIERAALASGFKYFGTHDWYRELGAVALKDQQEDGAWSEKEPVIDTAFTLLFLSRGRHPIFINKLRFDGDWADHPRDIANLAHYATQQLERPLNWQVVSLNSPWTDWMDAPILYLASRTPIDLQPADEDKLRSYAENGGLIFTMNESGSPAFDQFVNDLSRRLFPAYALKELPPDADVYTSLFHLGPPPVLQGVSNGSRLLLLHAPTAINNDWQLHDEKFRPVPFELGLNTFLYAAGKANLRNKLQSVLVPESNVTPVASPPVARLSYDGNWNPEPAAWGRLSRLTLAQTGIRPVPTTMPMQALSPRSGPLADLTGTDTVAFTAAQAKAVHDYVTAGGVLLIDSCGGSATFSQSVLSNLLPQAFPNETPQPLPSDSPLITGADAGMLPVTLKLRPHAAELVGNSTPSLQLLTAGRGAILFCPNDLTSGLLGTNTYGVNGLEPDAAVALTMNTFLWSMNR